MPAYYCARTTISDEYRETDLVVGMNALKANMRMYAEEHSNNINNIELYAKALESQDFAKSISNVKINNKTYKEN